MDTSDSEGIREKVNRVIHTALLTVIESDITFPADVFSHSGGCHTIPPIPPDILRCHIGSCKALVPEHQSRAS